MATFTYSGDPSASDVDAVRFLVGDTGPVAPATSPAWLLCNEEYEYLIAQYTKPILAAIAAAVSLSAKFARQSDELSGDLQRKCSQKSKAFSALADALRKQATDPTATVPIPFGGGISCADIESRQEDEDRFPDTFTIGEDDSRRGAGLKSQSELRNGFTRP